MTDTDKTDTDKTENLKALEEKHKKLTEKLEALQKAGKDPFDVYKVERTHTSGEIRDNYDELEGKTVLIAGRLMSKRVHGKAGFSDIYDRDGKLQLYFDVRLCLLVRFKTSHD